ncbi:S49 family peptidase [Cyclobacterium sp.]|uniref:S49 family peptidase n=1 Tax=Cyclobacterium sp. TaxID=1966343 RepID=UPI001992F0EF|nr:S49 family peptidase [Cyclobacterium sp.]MBD3630505.1 S49 family peptidase [Cyclobacterium sp.]
MTRLAGNWQFLLMSQLLKGKFFLRPELALGLGFQAADIINRTDRHSRQRRSLKLQSVSASGLVRSALLFDEDDEEAEEDTGSPYDGAPEGSVAIIPVKGNMMKYGTMCEYGTTEIASFMKDAVTHKNIGAIVLDIDSGGGAVDAVAPLVDVTHLAKATGKPVVASVDMACSAAYWIASEADYIVADNGISAEVGSIGVMMSLVNMKAYYEEKGINFHHIYSNESSEKNKPFELAMEGKYELIREEELDPLARGFQKTVKTNRAGKLNTQAKGILNGKTYFADEALSVGLIDRVGTCTTAVEIAIAKSHAKQFI